MIHDFRERLAWSEAGGDEPFWRAVYAKAFPDMVNCMPCPGDTVSQRMGIDRVVLLSSGKTISIDEKKRARTYDDILLEYVANDVTGAPGWIEKPLAIDYLAYAFMPTQECFLFPWDLLQRAWLQYKPAWLATYGTRRAPNRGYGTLNVPVPRRVLRAAVARASWIVLEPRGAA